MMVMSLEMVSVLASIRALACDTSTPNVPWNLAGSTLPNKSCRAAFSDIFLRVKRIVGPATVDREAQIKNRP